MSARRMFAALRSTAAHVDRVDAEHDREHPEAGDVVGLVGEPVRCRRRDARSAPVARALQAPWPRGPVTAPCWIVCVSSCAISSLPPGVSGWNCPLPKKMSRPVVNAAASRRFAWEAAASPVCTRTPLKSAPRRGSMNLRVCAGRLPAPPAGAAAAVGRGFSAGALPRAARWMPALAFRAHGCRAGRAHAHHGARGVNGLDFGGIVR